MIFNIIDGLNKDFKNNEKTFVFQEEEEAANQESLKAKVESEIDGVSGCVEFQYLSNYTESSRRH